MKAVAESIQKKAGRLAVRLGIYLIGIWTVSLGIVLCVKSGLGVSPISSVPYTISFAAPVTFGSLTMLFHLVNIGIQYLLEKRAVNVRVLLQIPVAVLFGWIIDLLKSMIVVENPGLWMQLLLLLFSIFFTALGMVLMIDMNLVQNPPDGTVRLLSGKLGLEMGTVKIGYDVLMVLCSVLLGLVLLGEVKGFGIATIFSAIFVGRTLSLLQKGFGEQLKRLGA